MSPTSGVSTRPAGQTLQRGRFDAATSVADLTSLVLSYARDPSRWLPRLQLPETDRWWTRLRTSADVDVWLLSWLPGHATELHDHGSSAAAFTVVRGQLEEVRLTPTQQPFIVAREPGTTTWVAPGVVHDVRAVGHQPAVSIHAYSPPLTKMTYYARDLDGILRASRTVETHEPEEELAR
jgi:quercetin dioxygenase-like cupin family protein